VLGRPPRIPQAGVVALKGVQDDAALLARFERAHGEALRWCQANPEACGEMAARHIDVLTPDGVADAIRATRSTMTLVPARDARGELEFFYQQLLADQPGLVGGKLPVAATAEAGYCWPWHCCAAGWRVFHAICGAAGARWRVCC